MTFKTQKARVNHSSADRLTDCPRLEATELDDPTAIIDVTRNYETAFAVLRQLDHHQLRDTIAVQQQAAVQQSSVGLHMYWLLMLADC